MKLNIEKIKEEISNLDFELIEEAQLNYLKKLDLESVINTISKGRLFLLCYNYLYKNRNFFPKDFQDYLVDFKDVEEIRELFEKYGDGEEIGSYYLGTEIKDIVAKNKKEINELIKNFFEIFGGEE